MTESVTYRGRTQRARAYLAAGNRAQAASILLRSIRDLQDEHSDYGTERTWEALQELFPGAVDEAESIEELQEALARIAEQARIPPNRPTSPRKPRGSSDLAEDAWQILQRATKATKDGPTIKALRLARALYRKAKDGD